MRALECAVSHHHAPTVAQLLPHCGFDETQPPRRAKAMATVEAAEAEEAEEARATVEAEEAEEAAEARGVNLVGQGYHLRNAQNVLRKSSSLKSTWYK